MYKKLYQFIQWTFLIVIILLCGVLLLANYAQSFPLKAYSVLTGSMQPTIPVGAIVFAYPVNISSLHVGNIITFSSSQNPSTKIVHRIYKLTKHDNEILYTTKGDNNNNADPVEISASQIQGVAFAYLPYLGYLTASTKTPRGFFVFVFTPALITMCLYFKHLLDGIKEYADNKAKKAVGEYIKSQRKAHSIHQLLSFILISQIIISTCAIPAVHAAFTTQVNLTNLSLTTASNFPTTTPCPTISLDQVGASSSIHINATTQGGTQTIQIQNQTTNIQSNSVISSP